jgi:hypothetical protein
MVLCNLRLRWKLFWRFPESTLHRADVLHAYLYNLARSASAHLDEVGDDSRFAIEHKAYWWR